MVIAFDFETYYDSKCSLTSLSYTGYIGHQDFQVFGAAYAYMVGDEIESGWLDDADVPAFLDEHKEDTFLFQNGMFDLSVLLFMYKFMPKFNMDTLAMARLLDGFTMPSLSLAALSEKYGIGVKGDAIHDFKGLSTLTGELYDRVVEYSIQDAKLTLKLYHKLKERIISELGEDILRRELVIIDSTLRMIKPQLKLDTSKLQAALNEENYKRQKDMYALAKFAGLPVAELLKTIRSRPKFSALLTRLGVQPPTKVSKTTGKETYAFAKGDDKFVKLIEAYQGTPIGELLVLKRDASSTITATRSQRFIDVDNFCGGMPVYLNFAGAQQTLRFSGGNKMNAQNLPRKGVLREAVIPPPGYKIVIADFSAIEARVLAWLADDEETLDLFRSDVDVYVNAASALWDDVIGADGKPDSVKRFVGKAQILALGYGAGWSALEAVMRTGALGVEFVFSKEQAESIIDDLGVIKSKLRDMYDMNPDKFEGYAFLLEQKPELLYHFAACEKIVNTYRRSHQEITGLWKKAEPKRLINRNNGTVGEKIVFDASGYDLVLDIPGGTKIIYHDMRISESSGNVVYSLGGEHIYTYGGKIIENCTQSVARNIMVEAWVECMDWGYDPVWSVHDELVFLIKEEDVKGAVPVIKTCMEKVPAWADGLPLQVKVVVADSYAEK